ncbi:MAG: restriction endonuclease subunit M [Paludibacteraceae bacterium]|nr:restriction endonuclease subunit M [Paludibacteraceae bacterium]
MDDESSLDGKQIKSRKRVVEHGEVFTNPREVNAMLDLVKQETERIESRFLEPACGDGNFLAEILRRKLAVCSAKVKSKAYSQLQYEKDAIISVSSIYGIEILEDNVERCRERLLQIFKDEYKTLFKSKIKTECIESARFLLSKNIIWGDALTYRLINKPDESIIISEWSPVMNGKFNRRDYGFSYMVGKSGCFFTDDPIKTYPPVYFLDLKESAYEV